MKKQYSKGYSRYVLAILVLTYTCSYLDRYVLSVLIEPIKADLGISDLQVGLLGGFAFALLYTLAGVPIARWADSGSRRTIISLGVAIWSVMSVACGLAKSFPQLLLARVGVGLGEAGCTPPAHSLIADYFPPHKRASALSIYGAAIPIGVMLGFLLGGWIAHYFSWRIAFVVVGAPGLLLALLVRFTIDEPERGRLDGVVGEKGSPQPNTDVNEYSFKEAVAYIAKSPALVLLQIGGAFYALAGYGLSFWVAPFFSRVHHLELRELATGLALAVFVGGLLGAFVAGKCADHFGRRGLTGYVMTTVCALALGLPLTALMIFVESPALALFLFGVQQFSFAFYIGPIYATMQFLVPTKMRALIVAVHLFILNLVGLGMGPVLIGAMNDSFATEFGESTAIRMSLMAITVGGLVAVALLGAAAVVLRKSPAAAGD